MSKIPKGVAEQRKKEILEEFRKLGKDAYDSIVAGRFPEITLPSRSVNNLVYDEKLKQYILGSNSVKRSSRNVKHIRPYTQLLWLAFFANQLVTEDRTSTLRDVFYSAQAFNMEFTDQSESDEIITDLETALMKAREDFNVFPDERSAIFGNMIIEYTKPGYEGKRQDLSTHPDGLMIGPALTTAEFVETDAEMVIAIEKGGLFTRFVEEKVHKRFKALLINTAGQPPRSTRYVIRRLNQELGLPVYLLADADPWGAHICMVIKSGSANAAHLRELTTPSAKWLGVYASITGDEPVVVEIDGMVRNEAIGELYSRYSNFYFHSRAFKGTVTEQVNALCCDEELATGIMPVDAFSKHRYDGDLYEIRTSNGFRVKATGNHSVQVFNRATHRLESRETASIKPGDLLATFAKLPNNQSLTSINFGELILKECPHEARNVLVVEQEGDSSAHLRKSKKKTSTLLSSFASSTPPGAGHLIYKETHDALPNLVPVTKELGRLLGYLVHGTLERGEAKASKLEFKIHEKQKAYDAVACLEKVLEITASVVDEGKAYTVSFENAMLELIYEKVLRIGSYIKEPRVPFILFNVPDDVKKKFIESCSEQSRCDWQDEEIRLSFKNHGHKFASDLVILLRQIGYLSSLTLTPRKLAVSLTHISQIQAPQEFNAEKTADGPGSRTVAVFEEPPYPLSGSRSGSRIDGTGMDPAGHLGAMSSGTASDILLLPVEKVTNLGRCWEPVYDIEVNGVHTFAGGLGGLILHNSDIQKYDLPHDKLTDLDIKRVHELQQDPRYEEKLWKDELECFLKYKKKAEQEAFSRYGLTYIVDKYLVDKLEQAKSM